MGHRAWLLVSTLMACSFSSSGGGGGDAELAPSTGDTGATETTAASMTGVVTTAADSNDTAGDASADGTSDPTDDPTTGQTSADETPADSTGSQTSTEDTGGAMESSGEVGDEPYPPCPGGSSTECPDNNICLPVEGGGGAIVSSWCGEINCAIDSDCPVPSTGNAMPRCRGVDPTFCVLDCEADMGGCPVGMICEHIYVGGSDFFRCAWPVL